MKRIVMLAALVAFVFGMLGTATAATEVRMVGDARIHANWYANYQFTGWSHNTNPLRTADPLTIWERFRLRTDFIANEALKFRLGLKVESPWGNGTFTADNSAVAVQVYQAYLQFKWPDTDITITAGYQPMAMPQSSFFNGSVVVDADIAGIGITVPVIDDTFDVVFGFVRYLDTNGQFDTNTTQIGDELDSFFLVLPITLDGFSITPWGTIGIAGTAANSGVFEDGNTAGVTTAGTFMLAPTGWKNNQNFYWWAGCAFEADAFDPIKLYADVIYGEGNRADYEKNKRWGWFIDGAIEYTGFEMLTPQLSAWWSSGEDGIRNGSERMPYVVPAWNASTSFLFDGGQQFKNGFVDVNPVGSWGITASLADISLIEDLTSRITFSYARGTNSKTALRDANLVLGTNNFFIMGKDLAVNEYVLGLSFDHEYMIYENLAFIAETGWAHGEFDKSVWGRRFYNAAGDMWKVSVGLKYQF